MTIIDRERVTVLTRKTKEAVEVWRRERKEALARQLAANVEIKQRWMEANPIEISQRQQGDHANAPVQVIVGGEPIP